MNKKILLFILVLALMGCAYSDCQSCGNLTVYYVGDRIESNFTFTGGSESYNSQYSFNDTLGILGTGYVYGYATDNTSAIPAEIIINTILNTSDYCDIYEMPFYWEASVTIVNLSNEYYYQYDETILADCTTTTTTTTTTTNTVTTTTSSTTNPSTTSTTTTGGTTSSSVGTTVTSSTMFPYSLPNENYGTLPGFNGSGGTLPGGGIGNTTGLGTIILGFETSKLLQWFAIFVALGLLMIKPYKLGVSLSAFCVLFFTLMVQWAVFTGSVCLIICFLAGFEWVRDYYGGDD